MQQTLKHFYIRWELEKVKAQKWTKKLIFLLVLNFLCYSAKSIEECKCSTLVNKFNLGNCLKTVQSKVMCYLEKDSKCPDSRNSKLYPNKKFSKLACELRRNSKTTNKANNVKFKISFYLLVVSILGALRN